MCFHSSFAAKGERLGLAPIYLRSLKARHDECSLNICKSVGRYDVVTYADASFLQMFLWERFSALSFKPDEFKAFKPKKVLIDGEENVKTSHYKHRGLRWSGVKPTG